MELLNFIPNIPAQTAETDYEIDGLKYCGLCCTRKQTRVPFMGEERIMPVMCKCQEERQKAEKEQWRKEQLAQRIADNKKTAFTREKYRRYTFENADDRNTKEIQQAKRYVEQYADFEKDGRGIIYFGKVGTGKTFISCCIANALLETGKSVLVRNFAEIANEHFMERDKEEVINKYARCGLLVLDDFAIERNTEYMGEIVYQILDARIGSEKPMIVTTNITPSHFRETKDVREQRLFSRINSVCIPIKLEGSDRRVEEAKKRLQEDMRILNGGLR